MVQCPLCGSSEKNNSEPVNVRKLVWLYKRMTGYDCNHLFEDDLALDDCGGCGLRFFSPLVGGDEGFYNSLQRFDWYYMEGKPEYFMAQDHISPGDVVLDVGCGRGAFSKFVEQKNGKFFGLDFSQNAKKIAAENGIIVENISIQEYADKHPESVDVVTSFQVAEHVSDVKGFIEGKLKCLKVGGKMIIAVPSESSFLSQVTNGILNMPPHHITRWSDEVFEFIAKNYGLSLLSIEHERLQNVHARWYLSTLFQNSVMSPRAIDTSIRRKLLSRVSDLIAGIVEPAFTSTMRPHGHTVLAVFQKL